MENNIQPVCRKCIEERKEKTQQYLVSNGLHVDDIVKVSLGKKKRIEHIWVIVAEIIGTEFFKGKINNHPLHNLNARIGDVLRFKIKDIEQICLEEK